MTKITLYKFARMTCVMMRHWQVIVTQTTGAIKYSVSDSVEEKGTIVNRKKPSVHACLVNV